MYISCGWENIRKKMIITVLLIGVLIFTCDNALAWGSVRTNKVDTLENMTAPSHDFIDKWAYNNLMDDPAWSREVFPDYFMEKNKNEDYSKIYNNEGVDVDSSGHPSGSGPDSPTQNTAYSWHEFNPRLNGGLGAGKAPEQAAEWFKKLMKDLENEKMVAAAKDAAYLAHYVADVTCPVHVNGMPTTDADKLPATGPLPLDSNIVGAPLPISITGMGRAQTPPSNERLIDVFPQGGAVRGTGGKGNTNWSQEYNVWRNLPVINDWFDPWYNDGTFVYKHWLGDVHLPESSSTHSLWEWYAYNNYSQPEYPDTIKVGYSEEFLKLQKENGNRVSDNIEKFVKIIAEKTRKNQNAILDESTKTSAPLGITSKLGEAYQEAISDVYTVWRASFSALRPKVEFGPGSESGNRKIVVSVDNNATEEATNIEIKVTIEKNANTNAEGECVKLVTKDTKVPTSIPAAQDITKGSITIDDKWELDIPPDCSKPVNLTVEVTGKFEKTPDSGRAVLNLSTPQEVKIEITSPEGRVLTKGETGTVDKEYSFSVIKTCIPDNAKYEWSFDDGKTIEGEKVTHSFTPWGNYKVNVNASWKGGYAEADTEIEIAEEPAVVEEVNFYVFRMLEKHEDGCDYFSIAIYDSTGKCLDIPGDSIANGGLFTTNLYPGKYKYTVQYKYSIIPKSGTKSGEFQVVKEGDPLRSNWIKIET